MPFDLEKNRDEIALFELREEVRKILPPVSEIAQLAALLSHGHPLGLQSWETYAQHAINLWGICHEQRQHWIEKQAHMKLLCAKAEAAEAEGKFPKPKKFPVNLDGFLRLTLPDKRSEDRMKLFREYIRGSIRVSKMYQSPPNVIPIEHVPETTDTEIAQAIDSVRQRGYNEYQFKDSFEFLQRFAESKKIENRKKRAQAGGVAKSKKQPPKK